MRLPNESQKLPGFNVQRFRQECQQYDLTKQTGNSDMHPKQFNEHHINNYYGYGNNNKNDENRNKLSQLHPKYSNKLTPSESDAAYETDIDVPKLVNHLLFNLLLFSYDKLCIAHMEHHRPVHRNVAENFHHNHRTLEMVIFVKPRIGQNGVIGVLQLDISMIQPKKIIRNLDPNG